MNILVSACLLGIRCRYDGKDNGGKVEKQMKWLGERCHLIAICPEVYGGLPTPRPPAECVNDRVTNKNGEDVTEAFEKGANIALQIVKRYQNSGDAIDFAILKAHSPSCGSGKIYDGTFRHVLTDGDGITAKLLKEHGLRVIDESQLGLFLAGISIWQSLLPLQGGEAADFLNGFLDLQSEKNPEQYLTEQMLQFVLANLSAEYLLKLQGMDRLEFVEKWLSEQTATEELFETYWDGNEE